MGDINQRLFLEKHLPTIDGPVLEVGSKEYGDGDITRFRDLYRDVEYLGVDMEEGRGVDALVDLGAGVGTLEEGHFALAICCSVLEHTPTPWTMAENIARLLRPRGALYISVPWVWRYHPYPDDYFRFSPRAVQTLLPRVEWLHAAYSTTAVGDLVTLDLVNVSGVDNRMAVGVKTPAGLRKYLPYLMVNMLGRKRG